LDFRWRNVRESFGCQADADEGQQCR
jgi:hypothetical protein